MGGGGGRALALLLALTGLAPCAAWTDDGRARLRHIVQDQCLPHWLREHDPSPCARVSTGADGSDAHGYALLRDAKGGAHFLLIPTRAISGIEAPELRGAGAFNYFAAAWRARDVLAAAAGRALPREAIAMAVNPQRSRSQDQLHIHISCLRAEVRAALGQQAQRITPDWGTIDIGGAQYQAKRLLGEELGASNPFRLLAGELPGAESAMQDYTVLVAAMRYREGAGFVLLAGSHVPGAELLLDASCAVAS